MAHRKPQGSSLDMREPFTHDRYKEANHEPQHERVVPHGADVGTFCPNGLLVEAVDMNTNERGT